MANAMPANVMSHWYTLLESLQASPLEFYTAIESAIKYREIPNTVTSRVDYHEAGVFSANRWGGLTFTTAPERWDGSWENQVALAQQAEAAGFDFILPLGTWLGMNGDAETDGYSYETLTWAAGLLSETDFLDLVYAAARKAVPEGASHAPQAVAAGHGRRRWPQPLCADGEPRLPGVRQVGQIQIPQVDVGLPGGPLQGLRPEGSGDSQGLLPAAPRITRAHGAARPARRRGRLADRRHCGAS